MARKDDLWLKKREVMYAQYHVRYCELLSAWRDCYPPATRRVYTLRRILADIAHHGADDPAYERLRKALVAFDPDFDGHTMHLRVIGRALARLNGYIVEGYAIRRAAAMAGGVAWWVKEEVPHA